MNGHEMDALTAAYAADALTDAERAAYEEHLDRCEQCRAEVIELRETLALFAELDPVEPPDSVRAGVLAGIDSVRPLPPPTPEDREAAPEGGAGEEREHQDLGNVVRLPGRRARVWLAAAAAAVAIVMGGVAVDQWILDRPSETVSVADQVRTAPDAETHRLTMPEGGTVSLLRSAERGTAVLVTDDMPEPPAGKTYELWLQSAAGEMLPAGLMDAGGDHEFVLEGDAADAVGAGITVEPEGGSPEPTSEPVALFEFEQEA